MLLTSATRRRIRFKLIFRSTSRASRSAVLVLTVGVRELSSLRASISTTASTVARSISCRTISSRTIASISRCDAKLLLRLWSSRVLRVAVATACTCKVRWLPTKTCLLLSPWRAPDRLIPRASLNTRSWFWTTADQSHQPWPTRLWGL